MGDWMGGSIERVLSDAEEVFRYVEGETHQDRAHRYIERNSVQREPGDTATLCAVRHMLRRAARAGMPSQADEARASLADAAAYLLREACNLS